MDITRVKVGTRCKLLQELQDLKPGQSVEICTEATFHPDRNITPDRSGDYWVTPIGKGPFRYLAYCTCDKRDFDEYLKVIKY